MIALVAAMLLLTIGVAKLYGIGDKKVVNPNNLVSIQKIGVANYAKTTGNTGYGVEVSVDDLGAIKMKGKATADVEYKVCVVTLTEGKTYTLSSGVSGESYLTGSNVSETGYALVLQNLATGNYTYGEIQNNGTFTVPAGSANYELLIIVKKDTDLGLLGKTFKPVLVEGKTAGNFTK